MQINLYEEPTSTIRVVSAENGQVPVMVEMILDGTTQQLAVTEGITEMDRKPIENKPCLIAKTFVRAERVPV